MKLRTLIALLSCVVMVAAFGGDRIVKFVSQLEIASHSETIDPVDEEGRTIEKV